MVDALGVVRRVERVIEVAGLLALACHHGDGVPEQPLGEDGVGRRGEDARAGMGAQEHGHRAEVVEVAVREDDVVDGCLDPVEAGQGGLAVELGVQAGVDHHPVVAELDEHAVGPDFPSAVEVGDAH